MHNRNWRFSGSLFTGTVVIMIGVFFLVKTMGFLPGVTLEDYWPVLLIFFGTMRIIYPHSNRSYFWGPVVVIIGGAFLAKNLHYIDYDITKLWPVLPILIGINILLRPAFGPYRHYQFRHHRGDCSGRRERTFSKDESTISDDELSISLVLSSGEYNCTSSQFKGGNISLTLAGCEIDLRKVSTELSEIALDVNLLLGGVEIRIPETWSVNYRGTPVLGSFEDNTRPVAQPEKKLTIKGSITLAGLEVRN
jgi:predicted membrane protein